MLRGRSVACWTVALGLALSGPLSLAATAGLSAEQIVDRYVSARGGSKAWQKVQTMVWNGHIESASTMSSQMPFIMMFKRPDLTRFEITAEGQKAVRVFDGKGGWKLHTAANGRPQVQDYDPEEVSFARDALGVDGPLVDHQSKGVKVALRGSGEVEGHKAYQLSVTLPSGAVHQVWIDAHSFLELKYERQARSASGHSGSVSVYYRNYQTIQGLTLPMLIETGGGQNQTSDRMIIERVALNPTLAETSFWRPIVGPSRRAAPRDIPQGEP